MTINYEAVGRFVEVQNEIRDRKVGVRDMRDRIFEAIMLVDSYAADSASIGVSSEWVEARRADLDYLLNHVLEMGKLEGISRELVESEPYLQEKSRVGYD